MKEHRVEAVERALSIIEAFSAEKTELSLSDIAEETGLYKSTILRLCGSLERYGYIIKMPSGLYRIGPSLWRLGSLYRRGFEMGDIIRPELKKLVLLTKETASFYIQEQNDRVCLYREVSPQPLRFHLDEGVRLPMDRGAAAHILHAFSEPYPAEYEEVREQGFAISDSERTPQIAAVAVPLFNSSGKLLGALGLSGPSFRFDEEARKYGSEVLKAAADRLANQ